MTTQRGEPTTIAKLLRANQRNKDPWMKYGNRDMLFALQGVNFYEDPVVLFKMHQFFCPTCTNHWQKGSKGAVKGCLCRNCSLYLRPYGMILSKTPYQGFRRMFGLFQCPCCPRFWASSCSWAEMSQQCRQCGAKVYPYQQLSLRERERLPPVPVRQDSTITTGGTGRKHLSELCERCSRTGFNCYGSGSFFRSRPVAQHFGGQAEVSGGGVPIPIRPIASRPRKLDNHEEVDVAIENVAETFTTTNAEEMTTTTEKKVERVVQSQSGGKGAGGGDTAESGLGQLRRTRKKPRKAKFSRRVTKEVQTLPTIEEIPIVLARQMPINGEDGRETKIVDQIHTLNLEMQDVCLTDRSSVVSCWKK